MQQIPAEFEITATLQAQEWQVVMETLADGRYRLVGPVIQKLSQQFESAAQGAQPQPQPVRNGADHPYVPQKLGV